MCHQKGNIVRDHIPYQPSPFYHPVQSCFCGVAGHDTGRHPFFVTPDLKRTEGMVVGFDVSKISTRITEQLRQVEAQQRSITQTVALMDSAAIDVLLPGLVDQYSDPNVFGGGIWPLPKKRDPERDKFSTFSPATPPTSWSSTPTGTRRSR